MKKLSVQEYLSLGYIYLVVLGIITDVIYFKFIGIDILNYSTILDVLISPINIIVHDLKIMVTFSLVIGLGYVFFAIIGPRVHFKSKDKKWYRKVYNVEKLDIKYEKRKENKGINLIAILVLCMFLGFGIGRGLKTNSKIKNGEIKPSHQIIFNNEASKTVKILGQNSGYVFYLEKNEQVVSVAPITNNIRTIRKIETD